MIDIDYNIRRAHQNTNKAVSFRASSCPIELTEQIKRELVKLTEGGYIFSSVRFETVESDFSPDYNIAHLVGSRMETQEERDKRVKGQERNNARALESMKHNLYTRRMIAEFNRITEGMTLEHLQAMSKKDFSD